MHYLLGGQNFYFPSLDDQSYALHEFLNKKYNKEYHLPVIVKITSLNLPGRTIKNLLAKNTPLLLLNTYQFESILAEYHRSNDGRYQSNRHRLTLTQGKSTSRTTPKFRTTKKLSKSLVTLTTNFDDDCSDNDYDNTRNILRTLNEKRSLSIPLCRVPINYHRFFELLNENDQAIEPFHQLWELIIVEYNDQVRTEKWPQAFFLRSTCTAYTKRYIPDERKLSGSADSCYGSLSDLDLHKNLLILNDNKQIVQPGQILTILNQCSAYRSQTPEPDNEFQTEQCISNSSSTSWLRNKSRLFFSRKKSQPTHVYDNTNNNQSTTQSTYDISKKSEQYLKCQTEQGDIVYISLDESGLFSPLNSQNYHSTSTTENENIDISGVFQLKELLSNFRFPISVRLLNNSISFDNAYSPATANQHESSFSSTTKFRLLLPYTEHVVFACPLTLSSSFKSQIIIIPIPINSDIEIQRCLNMREISKNKTFHSLIQECYHTIKQYQTEFSYIHFPVLLNTPTKNISKRKHPLFKKRSQSESHLEYYALDLSKDTYRKSCELLNDDDESDIEINNRSVHQHDQLHHRDSFETLKQKLTNNSVEINNSRQQTIRRSAYYAKLKNDKPRKSSRQQEYDSEDENYRELDHIYDYIRSGDVTYDIQKIQEKEKALNAEHNQMNNMSQVCVSPLLHVPHSTIKRSERRVSPICSSPQTLKTHRFSTDLDDSRPLDNRSDGHTRHIHYLKSRKYTHDNSPVSTNSKPIIKANKISEQ